MNDAQANSLRPLRARERLWLYVMCIHTNVFYMTVRHTIRAGRREREREREREEEGLLFMHVSTHTHTCADARAST